MFRQKRCNTVRLHSLSAWVAAHCHLPPHGLALKSHSVNETAECMQTYSALISPSPQCQVPSLKPERYCPLSDFKKVSLCMSNWQQVLPHYTFFFSFFDKQLAAVADFSYSFCLEALQWQQRPPFWCMGQNVIEKQGRKEGIKRKWVNRWMSEGILWVSDSGQVGSLASQSIWPQFRHERLLESGITEA